MKKSLMGVLVLMVVLIAFTAVCDVVWALKNVCPECGKMVKDMELTSCPNCGKIVNKCLVCGQVNQIKNDHCEKCSASLAESRVSRTISKEVRDDLRLGESDRAKIDVELAQIEQKVITEGINPELASRQVELLILMGWWSLANSTAKTFLSEFPNADQSTRMSACRVIALRNLGFLALEGNRNTIAAEYLKAALAIDPKDAKSQNLLEMANEAK
ncbi:MAG: hypothetical protein HQM10_12080 [Candidatus Riflebacteria bacterium]|nr:hypothetical protein [Candidatus Riflebacteria bacterium]